MRLIWILEARHVEDYTLEIVWSDGEKAITDLAPLLEKPPFERLKDLDIFVQFRVNEWTLEWPGGLDIAPEFVLELARSKVVV